VTSIDAQIPADLEGAVDARLERARSEDVLGRIEARDGTLWAPAGTPEVTDRLGWLDIADRMAETLGDLEAFVQEVRDAGLTDAVLCGMGGSSLAPEVFWRSFGPREGYLRLHVLDSTDPDQIQTVLDAVDLERALFVVSSKSGGTIETLSQFKLFHSLQPDGSHFVAVTDPGSQLEGIARDNGFRRIFAGDPEIGGRYSALSNFGLVPAALIGADVGAVLDSARSVDRQAGLELGCVMGELALAGRDKLTFAVHEPLTSFGLWVEQLIAESTGKQGKGILPVADEPLVDPGAYGSDRVFAHIGHGGGLPELRKAGQPVIGIEASDPADLGGLFFLWELATAVAGWVLEINPFDQPNVQEAKDNTKRVLDDGTPEQADAGDAELKALLAGAAPPAYVATMAYVAPDDAFDAAIAELRATLRAAGKATTTFGYGPRFLHSTGQLHKGGPKTGRFLQLVHHAEPDAEIPGAPYTFEGLKRAQATGDLQTLRGHALPAERVTLKGDPAQAVRDLTQRIKEML
jgi:transaldolase / glucose-6-phosphate isomerase